MESTPSNTHPARIPAGTPTGGQFARQRSQRGTVDLDDHPPPELTIADGQRIWTEHPDQRHTMVDGRRAVIAWDPHAGTVLMPIDPAPEVTPSGEHGGDR